MELLWRGGDLHILQCSKTALKAQEKNNTHVLFDGESEFLPLNSIV